MQYVEVPFSLNLKEKVLFGMEQKIKAESKTYNNYIETHVSLAA